MKFISYSFHKRSFPRFDNACAKSIELQTRYDNLVREGRCLHEKKNVVIVLCKGKDDTQFPIDINSLVSGMSLTCNLQKENTFDLSNIDSLLNSITANKGSVCVFIAESNVKTKIKDLLINQDQMALLVIDENANKVIFHDNFNVTVRTKENLKSEVENILERISLAPLKDICEHCFSLFMEKVSIKKAIKMPKIENEGNKFVNGVENGDQCDERRGKKSLHESRQEGTKGKFPKIIVATLYERTSTNSNADYQNQCYLDLAKDCVRKLNRGKNSKPTKEIEAINSQKVTDKKRKQDIFEQKSSASGTTEEDPEQILESILAVYALSNVPEPERPGVPKQNKKINEQMKEELFKICPSIRRMGYRYRTFYIYADKPVRPNKIHSVLKKYEIFPYEIARCSGEIQEFRHTGAKIEARSDSIYSLRSRTIKRAKISKSGTLGGFVKTSKGNTHYGLLAKHVTEHCSEIVHVENESITCLGEIVQKTNKRKYGGLDISAALMNDPVDEENAKFKDTRGTPLNGLLHEYNEEDEDNICRSGQSVHIHGAVSKPGIGEITMPIVDCGLISPLIQVEGRGGAGEDNFAEKGDSGAVLCVEDPGRKHVHAIGMLMGEVEVDSPRRTYLALPLSKGIQQIAGQTGTRLELM